MKKMFLIVCILLIAGLSYTYLYIPNIVNLKHSTKIKVTRQGLYRMLLTDNNVKEWWPGTTKDSGFYFNDEQYTFHKNSLSVVPVIINVNQTQLQTSLLIVELAKDEQQVDWVAAMITSYNPLKRITTYRKIKQLENDMGVILNKMQVYYSNPENIYSFNIKKELVKDSILIQTSDKSNSYPTTAFIYNLIGSLNNYVTNNNATVTGYPMLNIKLIDSNLYEVKVALPVNKILPNTQSFFHKRMLGGGNILVTEVTGGIKIGEKAFDAIQQYADDYQRIAPAIPFYSLISDRTLETDSTKWVTKVYFPVM